MKTTTFAPAASIVALLALSACANPPRSTVTDTGNMAYPAPLPQGNISTTNTSAAPRRPTDTGNMAYPAPIPPGNIGTSSTGRPRRPTDTGNMAYPAPLPQGNVGTTLTR